MKNFKGKIQPFQTLRLQSLMVWITFLPLSTQSAPFSQPKLYKKNYIFLETKVYSFEHDFVKFCAPVSF